MSNILLNWLNDDLQLSERISSIESCEEFADGYLLGEILHKYNQQSDFDKFKHDNSAKAQINNFCLLLPSLRAIGVKFDSKIARELINNNSQVLKLLLYDIKTSIDRIKRSVILPEIFVSGVMPKASKESFSRIVPTAKPLYDKTVDKAFENSIRSMVENSKDILMTKATRKYEDKKADLFNSVVSGHTMTMSILQEERHDKYDQIRSKKRHDKLFSETIDHISKDQWKINQKIAHDRRELKSRVDENIRTLKEARKEKLLQIDRENTFQSIEVFEKRLEREIFDDDVEDMNLNNDLKQLLVYSSNIESGQVNDRLTAGFDNTQNALLDHHQSIIIQRQSRDKHRAKFIAQQEAIYKDMVRSEGDNSIYQMVLIPASIEEDEKIAKQRILLQKDILQENRYNRDCLVALFNDVTAANNEINQNELLRREIEWTIYERESSQMERICVLNEAKLSSTTKQTEEFVAIIIDRLLDLTDWIVSYKEYGKYSDSSSIDEIHNTSQTTCADSIHHLPHVFWIDAMKMYEYDIPIASALPSPSLINDDTYLPYSLSEKFRCIDRNVLFDSILDTNTVMKVNPSIQDNKDISIDSISKHLRNCDFDSFLQQILVYQPPSSFIDKEPGSLTSSPSVSNRLKSNRTKKNQLTSSHDSLEKEDISFSPLWLTSTPVQCLLGETILAIDTTTRPIPRLPTTENNQTLYNYPIRMALFGISDLFRKTTAELLSDQLKGLKIIHLEAILEAASERYRNEFHSIDNTNNDSLEYHLHERLLSGSPISDDIYVKFVLREIESMSPAQYPLGFIIQDFPNTKSQALLLFKGLSGINYDSKPPQRNDRMSPVLNYVHTDEIAYDPLLCGLNRIIFLKNQLQETIDNIADYYTIREVIDETLSLREDLLTGEHHYLRPGQSFPPETVSVLSETHSPRYPKELIGIEKAELLDSSGEFISFIDGMKLLHVIDCPNKDSYNSAGQSIMNFIQSCISINSVISIPTDVSSAIPSNTISRRHSLKFSDDPGIQSRPKSTENSRRNSAGSISFKSNVLPVENKPLIHTEVKSPQQLADILHRIWKHSEGEYKMIGNRFFGSLRDVRHQLSQRRRCIHDMITINLLKKDNRQELFKEYQINWNNEENDFRYDNDCVGEYMLRAYELGDQLWSMSDARRNKLDNLLNDASHDNQLHLLMHRSRCEAAYFIQGELNRFFSCLNILLDYTKAMCCYDHHTMIHNALDDAVCKITYQYDESNHNGSFSPKSKTSKPISSNTNKDPKHSNHMNNNTTKKTKDHENDFHHSRRLIAPIVVSDAIIKDFVEKGSIVENKHEKANVKRGTIKTNDLGLTSSNPFEFAMTNAINVIQEYCSGKFVIVKASSEDTTLMSAVERAVWCEAERSLFFMSQIKEIIENQLNWLQRVEASMIQDLQNLIRMRYEKEVSVVQRLIDMICETISNHEPFREEWLLAPDALVVTPNHQVYSDTIDTVNPIIEPYYNDRLNQQQISMLSQWLQLMKIGEYVLESDMKDMLHRSLIGSGPLTSVTESSTIASNTLCNLTLPATWRSYAYSTVEDSSENNDGTVRSGVEKLMSKVVEGIVSDEQNELSGMYTVDKIQQRLAKLVL